MASFQNLKQEKNLKEFLRNQGIPFKQNKKWVGKGKKIWITDFYLPLYDMVIECKDRSSLVKSIKKGKRRITSQRGYDTIFKDLYKLDELGDCYGLNKVIFIRIQDNILSKTFIPNLTEHGIYLITEVSQILPILQGLRMYENNQRRFGDERIKKQKLLVKKKFSDLSEAMKVAKVYMEGKSFSWIRDNLHVHPETAKRHVRKLLKAFFEMEAIDVGA